MRRRDMMILAAGSASYVELTTTSIITSLATLDSFIQSGASCTNYVVINQSERPESGYYFYCGVKFTPTVQSQSCPVGQIYRRNSSGTNGAGTWTASGEIPEGTVLHVWPLDYIVS